MQDGDPVSTLNDNLSLPAGSYTINPDDVEVDNSVTIGTSTGTMPITPGGTINGQINFNAPNGNVVAGGMRFGNSGLINVTPINGAQGNTSGTLNVPFSVSASTCANLSQVCHDIKCYEFAITADGKISKANIRDVALICGNCDEPSCASLINPPCPPGPCEGNYNFALTGTQSGLCGCAPTTNGGTVSIDGAGGDIVIASVVGTSGSFTFTDAYYTSACSTCPALQLTNSTDSYVAVSGSGSWNGSVFSFNATMKTIPDIVSGTGPSHSISGIVNCN